MTGLIVFLGLIAFIAIAFMGGKAQYKAENEKLIEKQRILDEKKEAKRKLKELKQLAYDDDRALLVNKMGEPDKTIAIEELDVNKEIRAYSDKRIVSIFGKDYDFSSIIECHLTDNARVEKGATTITSTGTQKTDNGNMLGRAVVGGVLAGGVGAAIGGATAKRGTESTSVVHQGSDITHHDYTVWITVKDIASPLIQIPMGRDGAKANEVVSLMNVIISS